MPRRNVSLGAENVGFDERGSGGAGWVKRSPQKSVQVRSSKRKPAFPAVRQVRCIEPAHAMCAERQRLAVGECPRRADRRGRRWIRERRSSRREAQGCGAAASHSLSEPHSSASTWEKAIYRGRCDGITLATASRTSGNIRRRPVWKSSGSSSTTRYWLKEKAPGHLRWGRAC